MAGNSFGEIFRVTTCGESHGKAIAAIIDGCPSNLEISETEIQTELNRRKPGQSHITTARRESDLIHILSGVFAGKTTGTPILLLAHNEDNRSEDYDHLKNILRPSHADYTYLAKYGIRDYRGSGRASARETLTRVAAGYIARKFLQQQAGIRIFSYVEQVGHIVANINHQEVSNEQIESNIIRCPDSLAAKAMIELIQEVQAKGDSIGGIIKGVIRNVPIGLGEPIFDKLHADLGKAMLSINAVKGFDIGSGFLGVGMRGSEHNDPFIPAATQEASKKITTKTNHAGGILGGISSGEDIYFRVAFKPVSTISCKQQTVNIMAEQVELEAYGRHDPCVLPRAVPIVDAMASLVIMDHYLRQQAYNNNSSTHPRVVSA